MRVPFLPLSSQYLLLFGFVMTAILTGVRWNLDVFLNYTSVMPKDIEYSFMCLSAIWTLSFENHPCIGPLIYDMRGNIALLKGKFLGTFTWHSHFSYSGCCVDTQCALLHGKCSRWSRTLLKPSLNMKEEKLGPEASLPGSALDISFRFYGGLFLSWWVYHDIITSQEELGKPEDSAN